jgi:hypothetical protein
MSKDLSEYFLTDLKVIMIVKILEETLWVESVLPDNFLESFDYFSDFRLILFSSLRSSIVSLSIYIT